MLVPLRLLFVLKCAENPFNKVDYKQKIAIFATLKNGRVAEWLGRGLQNLLQRFESAPDLRINKKLKIKIMGVTRLKRKDRKNKTVSRLEQQFLKLATDLQPGSRSKEPKNSQLAKNNEALAKAVGR